MDSYDVNLINFVYPLKPVWNRSSQTASEHTPILNSQPKPKCPVLKENWAATWSQNIPCLLSRHPCRAKTSPVRCFPPRIKTSLHTMTLQGWMQQHHLVMAALILLAQLWGPARLQECGFPSFPQQDLRDQAAGMARVIHSVPSSAQGGWALPSASCQAGWFPEQLARGTEQLREPTEKREQISWCAWASRVVGDVQWQQVGNKADRQCSLNYG